MSRNRLFEPSLVTRNSGLYAHLYDQDKREIWRSESVTLGFPPVETARNQQVGFRYRRARRDTVLPARASRFMWPDVDNQLRSYDVVVWRNAVDYFEQLARFRQTLWSWLIITTTLLLVVMYRHALEPAPAAADRA